MERKYRKPVRLSARSRAHRKCASNAMRQFTERPILFLLSMSTGPDANAEISLFATLSIDGPNEGEKEEIPSRCALFGDVFVRHVCLLATTISHRRQNRIMWTPLSPLFFRFIIHIFYNNKTIEREREIPS